MAKGNVLRQTVGTVNQDEAPGDLIASIPAAMDGNTKIHWGFGLPTKDFSGQPFTGKGMTHLNVACIPYGPYGLDPTGNMNAAAIEANFQSSIQVVAVTPADGGSVKEGDSSIPGPDSSTYVVAAWVDDD